MGWAIMFLVLIALVIILSISLINWKIQIYTGSIKSSPPATFRS